MFISSVLSLNEANFNDKMLERLCLIVGSRTLSSLLVWD